MKKRLWIFIAFLVTLAALFGCGSDPRVDSDEVPSLRAYIHFVPSSYYGTSYLLFASVREKEIPQGETGRLIAEIRVNEESITSDYVSDYIQNFIWTVDGKDYISSTVTHAFPDTGIFDVTLRTVDFFGDTLHDTLSLYVTTPLSVQPISPENGFNGFNAFDSAGMTFEIQTEGINSWQDAVCKLYVSTEKAYLWAFPIDTIPCNGKYTIDEPFLIGDSTFLSDTTIAFYWGVTAQVPDTELEFNMDTSDVQVFYTALIGTDSSHLVVPVRYRSLASSITPRGTLLLQNSAGDTLALKAISQNPAVLHFNRLASDSLTLTLWDSTLTEYAPAKQSLYLSKSSYHILDTLTLFDTVPPVRIPARTRFARSDSIRFNLYDGGSGVSQNSLTVILAGDTLARNINGDVVSFLPNCYNNCELAVALRDYAGNSAASVVWNLKRDEDGDSLSILGPYNPGDL
ncbi:MAG: hypothetical protein K6A31_11265 [Fibrobacter sp.]|nr:hypothetical protein [Fibrobacter sp.]